MNHVRRVEVFVRHQSQKLRSLRLREKVSAMFRDMLHVRIPDHR
jgi:hypothetical protein